MTTFMLDDFIPGKPKAQPRPRAFSRKLNNGSVMTRMYDAGTSDGWKNTIKAALFKKKPTKPWDGPLRLDLTFYMPRPQKLLKKNSPMHELHLGSTFGCHGGNRRELLVSHFWRFKNENKTRRLYRHCVLGR